MNSALQNEKKGLPVALIGGIIAVIALIFGIFLFTSDDNEASKPTPVSVEVEPPKPIEEQPPIVEQPQFTPPVEAPEPSIKEPPMATEVEKPLKPELPSLNKSDDLVKTDLDNLYQDTQAQKLFVNQDLIRKFVVFVDNAAKGELIQRHSPVQGPQSDIKVNPVEDNEYVLDPSSYARYEPYVELFSMANTNTLIDQLKKFEPLVQQAHSELGYGDTNFKETLIEAIDIALAAPLVEDEVRLVAPSAMFKFADPELENLPAIQKLLIRMGPKNQLKVQATLEKLRKELVKK
ncbi:DUF3014 domain-containing protein [Catenovulum sediminis]|uniref:DUF3014 domain-containing protein n=1 Tax=Catenovulum sediminis TaxID=1740262 RepID=A0ABV1RJ55_9ALTE|nr:DUF3014 domain-containing protein [Catenovulum sediminis]